MDVADKDSIHTVMVVGSGSMGRGIILSFAMAGFNTIVLTRDPTRLSDLPQDVTARQELPEESPDLIIEAIPEKMELKEALIERLEQTYGDTPILASNTSSLPLDKIADGLKNPGRFIGIHYMHPAESLPMVEVIRVSQTSDHTLSRVKAALKKTGKESIVLKKPIVGFLINRLQHALLHEAYYLIEEGIVEAKDIDDFAKWMFGPRMCVTGLIEQKDISGLDTHALAQQGIVPHLHLSRKPSRVVQDRYERGELGVKTGRGFYDWRGCDVASHKAHAEYKLQKLIKLLKDDR